MGYHFHLIAPNGTALDDKGTNLSIFSKLPFGERIDTGFPFYLGGREVIVEGQVIRFFSNWFHYVPWSDAPETLGMNTEELLVWEQTGTKYEMLQKVLPYLKHYTSQTDSIPMIFGEDLNAPSQLDWGDETRSMHNDLVVPWYTTRVLEDMGLIDTFRTLNPNPVSDPGITWDTKDIKDEHRIDYIYYKGSKLKPINSETYKTFLGDSLNINNHKIPYPSDHGIVVTTFKLTNQDK